MGPARYFSLDFLHRGALQPPVAVAGVVAGAGSIDAEKAGQTIQAQFSLQNREGMAAVLANAVVGMLKK